MCGIIAVLSRPPRRPAPDGAAVARALAEATREVRAFAEDGRIQDRALAEAVRAIEEGVRTLGGFAGFRAVLVAEAALAGPADVLAGILSDFERRLDAEAVALGSTVVERMNALLVRLEDASFTLRRDRLANAAPVRALAAGSSHPDALRAAYAINLALNALDRLEVRGRDSAGVHLYVRGAHDGFPPGLEGELRRRLSTPLFSDGAVRRYVSERAGTVYGFVYKVAAEVGELGENVAAIRRAITSDALLRHLLASGTVEVEVLGHTRWASAGAINEQNAHPLDELSTRPPPTPPVVAALNGDVDNFLELIRQDGLDIASEITTDAKVIPLLVSRALARGRTGYEAFSDAVNRFEGSVAIAAASAVDPGRLYLALRGSGQALYVGFAEDAFVVASEPYGLVEETRRFVRMDGETPSDAARPGSRGQIVVLDAASAGTAEGVLRTTYDGRELPVEEGRIRVTEITTRDIDRGAHRHFLRKEIEEAPDSIRKTMRGRLLLDGERPRVVLGAECFPESVRSRLASGDIRRIRVIGQGTAAIAGAAVAEAIRGALARDLPAVDAMPATEASGFHLQDDLAHHLYVAISQSGTTTDTNRTVDLLRARGAAVLAIVNRRNSDLTERADGIIYTSDGRDVEMSVASTKAFYSQVTAGFLLAEAIADACGVANGERRAAVLRELASLPDRMHELLARDDDIAAVARETAPPRRNWAIVGNGRNLIAAEEIRIKLSELCYRAIACDATEDKKHIDLSSEPLVLVCAAGLTGGNAADVVKEVAIYEAHEACPVVIASDASDVWNGRTRVIRVPSLDPALAFLLSTMAGHLYGYHAAMSIDALALPLRELRGHLDEALERAGVPEDLADLRLALDEPYGRFKQDLQAGRYDGTILPQAATRLSLLLRYVTGRIPLDGFEEDFEVPGTPSTVVEHLLAELTAAIQDLSRPIDAIKHQAKTVTVGISRGDEALLAGPLGQALARAGVPREHLSYDEMRVLHALDPAVEEVLGHTRYAVETPDGVPVLRVTGRGGLGTRLRSRTESDPTLRGTKNTVATEKRVLVAQGRHDRRPIVLVPELSRGQCVGMVVLHVRFAETLDVERRRTVLTGYRNRYNLIRDAAVEANAHFDDRDLLDVSLLDLLAEPVLAMADRLVKLRAAQ